MLEIIMVIFYAAVLGFSLWLGDQTIDVKIFFTCITWIFILAYCYIRFGILKDKI